MSTIWIIYQLAQVITSCKIAYYQGAKTIHDEEYDILEDALRRLHPKHPILSVVGIPETSYKNPTIVELKKEFNIL